MIEISASILKQHLEKYLEIGKTEQIKVTQNGKIIFTIVPESQELMKKWDKMFGILPKEAAFDDEIDRE